MSFYIYLISFFAVGIVLIAKFVPGTGNRHRNYIKHLSPINKLRYASKALARGVPLWKVRKVVGLDE